MASDDDALAATAVSQPAGPPGDDVTRLHPDAVEVGPVKLSPGQQVGRFVLVQKLGEGGMGVVFIARDPELQRDVALKVLRPGGEGTDSTQAQQRMLREAQAMAMISHPNMVAIYEVGTFEKHVFIAMEYVVGKTLDDWLEEGKFLEDIWEVFEQAGNALQAIHDAGLVHRDFKPANVLVTADGVAKVLDLGIARKVSDESDPVLAEAQREITQERVERSRKRGSSTPTGDESGYAGVGSSFSGQDAFADELTQEGALVGTPSYMAPEQLLSQPVGPATDQFAFAIAFFEALTNKRPFAGETHMQIMANIIAGEIRPWPEGHEAPQGLREALERALKNDPAVRYSSMNELLQALRDGLGLRGQIRFLTTRWKEGKGDREFLLPEGSLLREGVELLRSQPDALSDEQEAFIRSSQGAAQKRKVSRRVITWGLGAVTLGLIPTVLLLDRRSRELELATQSEVQANIAAVREAVTPVLESAHNELMIMFGQRAAWSALLQRLLDVDPAPGEERDRELQAAIAGLNDYFRPVVERIGVISSLMVASEDEMEFLVFLDPDAHQLTPPYDFYNRFVRRSHYGDAAFEVFWSQGKGEPDRSRWLQRGDKDSRNNVWSGYHPSRRVWFKNAMKKPDSHVAWTKPYLFFVTKDAGVTGSVPWTRGERRFVLAVDFMLTDLSLVTTQLDASGFVAAIVSKEGDCIGLPHDPRFSDANSIRQFFSAQNLSRQGQVDASAALPKVTDIGLPVLSAALRPHARRSEVYEFMYQGQRFWAGRGPVGDPSLGLSIYVVQLPKS